METKFYLVETEFQDINNVIVDDDYVEIRTVPARKNMNNDVCTRGWCGTTNDWSVTAHGEFDSLESARAALVEIWGDDFRELDKDLDQSVVDEHTVELFKIGRYARLSYSDTLEFLFESMHRDVTVDSTDEELENLAIEYEESCNTDSYEPSTIKHVIADVLSDFRSELVEQRDTDAYEPSTIKHIVADVLSDFRSELTEQRDTGSE